MRGAMAGGASLMFFAVAAPLRADTTAPSPTPLFDRSLPPPSYTFRLDVALTMRSFPWLRFHMQGDGVYSPGESYVVHFTSVPWFLPMPHDADLSMLDPLMWPNRYTYQEIGMRGDETLFALHALADPSLKSATVTIGPRGTARSVVATYNDGTRIATKVRSSNVDGFFLPLTIRADIDEPAMALSANGTFKDYAFSAGPQPRPSPSW